MTTPVTLSFDASLKESHHGACFMIQARDWQHAQQIAEWLRTKTVDAHIVASVPVEPVVLVI